MENSPNPKTEATPNKSDCCRHDKPQTRLWRLFDFLQAKAVRYPLDTHDSREGKMSWNAVMTFDFSMVERRPESSFIFIFQQAPVSILVSITEKGGLPGSLAPSGQCYSPTFRDHHDQDIGFNEVNLAQDWMRLVGGTVPFDYGTGWAFT